MKKLLAILGIISLGFSAVDPDTVRVIRDGDLEKVNAPRQDLLILTGKSKPADADVAIGTVVLYATVADGAVDLQWIAKDVSSNVTSGDITGI